ncbi:YihY family inner membrane protein [Neisseriaceae bacterium B1]
MNIAQIKQKLIHIWQSPYIGFARFVVQRFLDNGIPQIAGSLTYTTLLALVPLLTVMLVIITAFPMFGDLSDAFMNFVRSTIVPSGASTIAEYLNDFKDHAGKLTSIGIIMMVVTSMMLVQTIDETFNRIWQVRRQRSLWVRLPMYWVLLTIGPLVVGLSITVSAYFMRLEMLNQLPYFAGSLKFIGQVIFNTILFCGIFRFVPNRYVSMKHALVGGFITGLLIELAKAGFGLYIKNFNSYELIYGAFAAIPVFLVWLQILWMIVLSGAVFTSSLSYWRGEAYKRANRTQIEYDDIVALLLLLADAQAQGKTMRERSFRQHLPMGYDQLGNLLEALAERDYIEYGKQGWLLKTTPEHIRLSTLFTQFVYNPNDDGDPPINSPLHKLLQPCLKTLDTSLADLMKDDTAQEIINTRTSLTSRLLARYRRISKRQ